MTRCELSLSSLTGGLPLRASLLTILRSPTDTPCLYDHSGLGDVHSMPRHDERDFAEFGY